MVADYIADCFEVEWIGVRQKSHTMMQGNPHIRGESKYVKKRE